MIHVSGYEGAVVNVSYSVTISCPYESEYQNNLKYICRGTRPSICLQQALITSDNKENGRFRLDDDKVSGTFTVNITRLTRRDSGLYLCGVQRNSGLDVFSAVELQVKGKIFITYNVFYYFRNKKQKMLLYSKIYVLLNSSFSFGLKGL
uniref:Immunoglobulin domain-containing protein n=1 Tax=Oreochromis aureus TaxID=47969 RepID=A0A668VY57_OREAU